MGEGEPGPLEGAGPGDVLVVAETPEVAQALAGLVRGAGGRPVVVPSSTGRSPSAATGARARQPATAKVRLEDRDGRWDRGEHRRADR